jgi:hypothetical protein
MPDKRGEEEIWTICPLCAAAAGGSLVNNLALGLEFFDFRQGGFRAVPGTGASVPRAKFSNFRWARNFLCFGLSVSFEPLEGEVQEIRA